MRSKLLFIVLFITNFTSFSQCLSGDCVNGYGTYGWPNGDKYYGSFVNGSFHGIGTLHHYNGDKYEGDFRNDIVQGKGVKSFNNGNKYIGDFIGGTFQGKGTFFWNNGDKYVGDWVNGARQGKGIYTYGSNSRNNKEYSGDFISNTFTGYGVMYYLDSSKYEGEWVSDVQQGKGKRTNTSGLVEEGIFVSGTYVGEEKQITQNSNISLKNEKTEIKSSLNYVEIDELYIQNADLGIMNYYQVKNSLASIGDGWRLPNESELIIMFQNRDKIGGLTTSTRTVNKHLVASYLGGPSGALGAYNTPLITNQEAAMFGKTYQTSWSEHSKQNFYFYIRLVKDKPQKNYTENAIKAYVELVNFANKNGISLSNESKTTSSSASSSTAKSFGKSSCTYCKPYDAKGHYIKDFDPSSRTYKNGRYIKRPGYKPCNTCKGSGTCLDACRRGKADCPGWCGDNDICAICNGDRFVVCNSCKGNG